MNLTQVQGWVMPRIHRIAIGVMIAVFVVLLVQTFHRANRTDGYDFTSYLISAKALWQGGDPYHSTTRHGYIYPLFLAFVLIPLTAVPYWLANLVWFGLSVASLFAVCQMLLKMAENDVHATPGRRCLLPPIVVLLVLISPIQNNMLNGQVNLIVLFCCTMFLRAYTNEKTKTSAAWLAAAIAIKLVPAILLVFLLVRGRFRVLFWTGLFTIVFCLLPVVVTGKNLFAFYEHYWKWFFLPSAKGNVLKNGMFFNLRGTIEYFLPAAAASVWTRIIGQSVSLLAIVATDLVGRKSPRLHRDTWAFAAYMLGCLLVSPVGEIHHLVLAVPAVCLVSAKASFDRGWRTKTILAILVCFVLCFDVGAKMYTGTPLFFVSLSILLGLVCLANRDFGPDLGADDVLAGSQGNATANDLAEAA